MHLPQLEHPSSRLAALSLGLALAATPSPPLVPSSGPGVRAWLLGDAPEALRALESANASDRLSRLNRAVVLLYLGQPHEAESLLRQLRAQDPRWTPALRWLARAQYMRGQPEAADSAVSLLARPDADSRDALWAGHFFAERADWAKARDAFARAVDEESGLYLGWLGLGQAEAELGHRTAARQAWLTARDLYGGGEELFLLGRDHWEQGEKEEARRFLQAALASPAGAAHQAEIHRMLPELSALAEGPIPYPASEAGEVLLYHAKYLFFSLADLTISNEERVLYRGSWANRLHFHILGKGLLHIDSTFESLLAAAGFVLRHTNATADETAPRQAITYEMDQDRRICTIRSVSEDFFGYDRLPLPPGAQDGVSVTQLARALARRGGSLAVLTATDGTWKGTHLRSAGKEWIRWQNQHVPTVRVEVVGDYKGPGGLSGTTTLWISDDERALPYRARMKVVIGSVRLELAGRPVEGKPTPRPPSPGQAFGGPASSAGRPAGTSDKGLDMGPRCGARTRIGPLR